MNGTDPAATLAWTGERLVTTCNRPLVFEHLHRYAVACLLAEGKRVLDIACGEGYGANLLARTASKVTGVDLDATTIAHAKAKYQHGNIEFIVGDCTEIPCADRSVDLVASFETIEHLDDHERFMAEIKRVLVPGGVLIISSPDKVEYRAISGGANRFHKAELSHGEFIRLMKKTFEHCLPSRQRLVAGSWIGPDGASSKVATGTFHGGFKGIEMEPGVARGVYSLAVCSDQALPAITLGLFEDARLSAEIWHMLDREETPAQIQTKLAEAVRHKAEFEALLQRELEEKNQQIAASQEAFEKAAVRHRAEFEEKVKHIALLQSDLEEKSRQVSHFKDESERQARALDRLHGEAQLATERLARVAHELNEARWELLTFRGNALGGSYSQAATTGALEAQNRAEIAESERDCLRGMVHHLQTELEGERAALESTRNELRLLQKRVQTLLQSFTQKLILPFSSPQRKLRRLIRSQNGG